LVFETFLLLVITVVPGFLGWKQVGGSNKRVEIISDASVIKATCIHTFASELTPLSHTHTHIHTHTQTPRHTHTLQYNKNSSDWENTEILIAESSPRDTLEPMRTLGYIVKDS
jgi:hypothetical protein